LAIKYLEILTVEHFYKFISLTQVQKLY